MKFLVRDIHGDPPFERTIEAVRYEHNDTTGRHNFYDKKSNLLASLVNVNVEPAAC